MSNAFWVWSLEQEGFVTGQDKKCSVFLSGGKRWQDMLVSLAPFLRNLNAFSKVVLSHIEM